jgi:glutamyl-tRNA reductase
MFVAVAGISHHSAPVEVREKVAFSPCAGKDFLGRLRDENLVLEAVLLSTCNRTELYVVMEGDEREKIFEALARARGMERDFLEENSYWLTDSEAVGHIFRVASSLDSMVVGEAQILGQVREAYRMATEEDSTGPVLNRLLHTALRVGKEVRSHTGLGQSSLSVPHVAVKLAEEAFGSLSGRKALVLGAGEMSELVIKHLQSRGIEELRITNRTPQRARSLAERVGGVAVELRDLAEELAGVDVVVSSTGSGEWVVSNEEIARALSRRQDPLFLIDIAVPRDVEPVVQSYERVFLYDLDDLQSVVERNAGDRDEAAARGEEMVQPEVFEYMRWLSTQHVVPLIKELRTEAERIRDHELSRTLKRADLSPKQEAEVEKLTYSLVNKLLHGPISEVKARAEHGVSPEEEKRDTFLGGDVETRIGFRQGSG